MELKVNIRKIESIDFEFIYHSLCDLQNKILDTAILEKIFFEQIANPNNLYLIAENDVEKMGFITFHTQNLLHHGGLVGEIQEFYILPTYRNNGVGRQLIDEVMNFSAKNKLKSIEVTSSKKRVENVAIYENLGFSLSHNKFTIYN